jgi:hypothetical protein
MLFYGGLAPVFSAPPIRSISRLSTCGACAAGRFFVGGMMNMLRRAENDTSVLKCGSALYRKIFYTMMQNYRRVLSVVW